MVSVIIPIYNVEKYLRECVDSVLAQTYTDLEIILVDDGSPDNCGSICDEYAASDKRVKVIHKVNGGLSDARNAGLDIAVGEYIYFVDSDDSIKPETIEHLVSHLEHEAAEIVCFNAETIYEDFEDKEYTEDLVKKRMYCTGSGAKLLLSQKKNGDFFACAWLHLFRRDFIEKYKLRFLKGIMHEDELFSAIAYIKADRVSYLNEALYVRRLRAGSLMSEKDTSRSVNGLAACIVGYTKEIKKHAEGADERKALLYMTDCHANLMMLKFANLEKSEKQLSIPEIKKAARGLSPFRYTGCRKTKLKLNHPQFYCLARELLLPIRKIKAKE